MLGLDTQKSAFLHGNGMEYRVWRTSSIKIPYNDVCKVVTGGCIYMYSHHMNPEVISIQTFMQIEVDGMKDIYICSLHMLLKGPVICPLPGCYISVVSSGASRYDYMEMSR